MTSQTSSGAASSMTAEKANRDSLAKKKSAVKVELDKISAELQEIEQLKAEAEDLEDEEMLTEMQAEEQRLQVIHALASYINFGKPIITMHIVDLLQAAIACFVLLCIGTTSTLCTNSQQAFGIG